MRKPIERNSMSVEFFELMEKVEKKVKAIKFLENSHSEITGTCLGLADKLMMAVDHIEEKIIKELKKELRKELKKGRKNGRNNPPKSKRKTKI